MRCPLPSCWQGGRQEGHRSAPDRRLGTRIARARISIGAREQTQGRKRLRAAGWPPLIGLCGLYPCATGPATDSTPHPTGRPTTRHHPFLRHTLPVRLRSGARVSRPPRAPPRRVRRGVVLPPRTGGSHAGARSHMRQRRDHQHYAPPPSPLIPRGAIAFARHAPAAGRASRQINLALRTSS